MTLGACEWLDKKHTIFGKITGNTIFNLLRIGDIDVDKADKPLDDVTITSIEVLWNPFDDIVPSVAAAAMRTAEAASASKSNSAAAAGKSARKSTKDNKLLSFGDEEEGEDATEAANTWATAMATKKKLKLAAASVSVSSSSSSSSSSKAKSMNEAVEMSAGRVPANLGKRKAEELVPSRHLAAASADSSSSSASNRADADAGTGTGTDTDTGIAIETTAMKIARMKKELAHSLNDTEAAPAGSATGSSSSAGDGATAAGKAGNLLEQQRAKYTTRGAGGGATKKLKRGDEGYEEAMLAKLSKFSGKMKTQSWAE